MSHSPRLDQWYRHPILTHLATLGAGACGVLGFAPFGYYLLPFFAMLWLFWVWHAATPAAAFRHGWLFGLGLMGCGVFWLRISISQFGGVDAVLATTATLGFIAFISLYFGVAGWIGCKLTSTPNLRLTLTLPAAWGLMEWLRGWLFTGFPWLAMGYSQLDSPLSGYAPVLGVYGVSWVLALSVGCLVLGVKLWHTQPRLVAIWIASAVLPWGGGILLTGLVWSSPSGASFAVSLIQPSIPQSLKWDPERRLPTLETYQRLTQQAQGTVVIWPETAVPDFLHRVEAGWLRPLAQELAQRHAHLLVGAPVLDPDGERYYNGAVLVGATDAAYYKRHLVPFGEYLPLRPWLGPMLNFLQIPMSNFTPGPSGASTIKLGEHIVGVSICYEDAFGTEVREALPAADYLVNLSNDAWFGNSLAPHQHLEIARMRALEMGRPLIRATNSGISAIIGPQGQIQAASSLFTATVLTGTVQPMTGKTPFVIWGNDPAITLMLLGLLGGIWGRRGDSKQHASLQHNQ